MADFVSSQSTVVQRWVAGNLRGYVCEYSMTTAAAVDTVTTPLTRVLWGTASMLTTASTLIVAGVRADLHLCSSNSTALGQVIISHSTVDLDTAVRMRYTVMGF